MRPPRASDRDRRALDALLLVVPASAGGREGGRGRDPAGDGAAAGQAPVVRTGPRWTEIGGADGSLGTPTGSTRRGIGSSGSRGVSVARRADEARRGDPSRGGSRRERRATRFARGRLMSILRLEGVHREVGTFVILDSISAAIALGDRVGLVGPNGAGKTTLLRIAAGIDEPDAGRVSRKRELSIGMLAQEAHLDERFMAAPDVRAAVRHGAGHLEAMAVELEVMERAHRATEPAYEALQHRFEGLGGYTLDQRVDEALSGLGFTIADMARPPSSLSGGEQTRATLARLVIAAPDLLLPRRAHEPPRPGRAGVAGGSPPSPARLAARRFARPGVPGRDRQPDLGAAGSEADGLPRRLHVVPPAARGARRTRGEVC